MHTQEQVNEIVRRLLAEYPEAVCALDYDKDYELLFSVRLSAQCTDARVNMVTPALFARFPTLEAFAEADVEEVHGVLIAGRELLQSFQMPGKPVEQYNPVIHGIITGLKLG